MRFHGEAREPARGRMFPNTPAQHAEVLHPVNVNAEVFVARRSPSTGKWSQNPYQPWELDAVLYDASGAPDTYVSMNRFKARRKVLQQHLRALTALYADIDYYDVPKLSGRAPEAVLELALGLLQGAGIPEPSLALYSGRGLYLVWLHKPLGWETFPRWQDCQYRIWRVLKPLGADPKARDAARVLRLVGTTNSKNGGLVYALSDVGSRRDFEELATSIPSADRAEDEERTEVDLYDLRLHHATRGEYKAPRHRTERSLWLARWVDLQTLRHLRYGEEQMGDFRDRWLFLAGVAMSWITDPPEPEFFERELVGLAEQTGGWSEERSRAKLGGLLERVRMVARGQKASWLGAEVDPRYRFRTGAIVQWLEISMAEQREMFNLIGADEKRRRNTASKRDKRRVAGAKPRHQYDKVRRASLEKKRATARRLRDQDDLSTSEIAEVMGVSRRTVRRLLK